LEKKILLTFEKRIRGLGKNAPAAMGDGLKAKKERSS